MASSYASKRKLVVRGPIRPGVRLKPLPEDLDLTADERRERIHQRDRHRAGGVEAIDSKNVPTAS
jgi:hypothetical protein